MKLISILLLFTSLSTFAQINLTGNLIDSDGAPIAFANVVLLDVEEGTFKYGTSTDETGNFSFPNVINGDYNFNASFVGYVTLSRKLTLQKNTALNNLTLETDAAQLDTVTIIAEKPTIERKSDRLIFNVENTTLSTGNASQILQSTPGVFEMNGTYTVKGSVAQVYINNKRVYLSNEELEQLLSGYSGENVKSVEVIHNPPARYDAEGGAVINIVTSKNVSLGYKGSLTGKYEIDTFAKYNIGTSQYYKNNWLNVYANYNFNPRKDLTLEESQVGFFNNDGTRSSRWFTDLNSVSRSQSHAFNTIIDININEKNSLSILGYLGLDNGREVDTDVNTLILPQGGTMFSGFNTDSSTGRDATIGSLNLGWNNIMNDNGGTLSVEGSYFFTEVDNGQDFFSTFFDDTQTTTSTNSFNTVGFQDINIFTAKADYLDQIGAYSLSAGLKYSDISSQSKQDFFDTNMGSSIDPSLSDNYSYDEHIYAAYAQLEREWTKWSFTGGLRLEQTDVVGDSETLGLVNSQNYLGFFPNISVTHNLNEKNDLSLSYKRSIERPRYGDLNPFNNFINDNNIESGNPNLQPAFTNKVTLGWTYDYELFVDAYYIYTKGILDNLPFQNNNTNVLTTQSANLNYEFQYSVDATLIKYPTEKWTSLTSVSAFYMENEFKAIQSISENQRLNTTGFFIQTQNLFELSKDGTLNMLIEADYITSILFGSYKYENMLASSIGFSKRLWNDRAILTAKYSDIFLSQNQPFVSRYANQDNRVLTIPETQLFTIGFTYKFGNFRLDNREPEASEELERTGKKTKGL
ncbi:putative TonB-dependent receptor [Nonlabens ulvanivorans]|uniref:Putative TonB-dependent receptor n=1 Tax=Nonlabens ulvanivorans TaxID=906888 RepID=A0A081D719_NONUL|nr:outer membrane beta-barrel family protein [Nonlabens ulvanivorans]GAK74715.1 putative TonB-dependent receptor [Nonlabens ulvanivorans]